MNLDLATATLDDVAQARVECRKLVAKRALVSGAAVLVPLPGTDIIADVGILMQLLPRINARFGLSPEQVEELGPELKIMVFDFARRMGLKLVGKAITTELVTSLVSRFAARLGVKSAVRFVPVLGQAAAAAISIGVMRYVGNSHVEACHKLACQLVANRDNHISK